MCDMNHQHAKLEEWITPETSRHLSAKMVHLWPGDSIPEHTTGPGREEVITVIYGTLTVSIDCPGLRAVVPVSSGQAIFIPENCVHSVRNEDAEAPAQYAYVVTKRKSLDGWEQRDFAKALAASRLITEAIHAL